MKAFCFLFFLCLSLLAYSQDLKIVFVGDSQQREIFGSPTGFSSKQAQEHSKVAIRSSEQDLFSKYVQRMVLELESGASTVIHLGDLLDYSCASEWDSALDVLAQEERNKIFLATGNHDGNFQGNNNYGSLVKFLLRIMKIFNPNYDPSLSGHFGAVCNRSQIPAMAGYENTQFRKKDVFCAYLRTLRGFEMSGDEGLLRFCEVVENARSQPLDSKEALYAKLHFPSENADLTVPMVYHDDFAWSFVAHFPELQTASWTSGFFVQSLSFSLSENSKLHFVLLDATDWQAEPSFGLGDINLNCNASTSRSVMSTKCGNVSEKQRGIVGNYLDSLDPNDIVILVGHYPVKELGKETYDWVLTNVGSDFEKKRMYVSAHTHSGYVTNEPVKELNLDSLIDNPPTYWTMVQNSQSHSVCFYQHNIYDKLNCKQVVGEGEANLRTVIQHYKHQSAPWFFDGGESQWRVRAEDAFRAINDFISKKNLDIACEAKESEFFRESSMQDIIQTVSLCQDQLDDAIKHNRSLQVYAACQSIVGSEVFQESCSKETAKKFCILY